MCEKAGNIMSAQTLSVCRVIEAVVAGEDVGMNKCVVGGVICPTIP